MRKEYLFNVIGEVDEQKVASAGMAIMAKKKFRPIWLKWGVMAACLFLIFGVFIVPALQGGRGTVDPQPNGIPGAGVVQPEKDNEATQLEKANLIVVNEVENIMVEDMDVQISHYDILSEVERETMLKQFEATIGFSYNDFTAGISDTFISKSFYSLDIPADDTRTEYIPHDYVFEYQTENDGGIKIAICSAEEPLRDYFILCDNPKQSEINGVSVMIYNYQSIFMVEFSHENINYDIETRDITLEELEGLLTELLSNH